MVNPNITVRNILIAIVFGSLSGTLSIYLSLKSEILADTTPGFIFGLFVAIYFIILRKNKTSSTKAGIWCILSTLSYYIGLMVAINKPPFSFWDTNSELSPSLAVGVSLGTLLMLLSLQLLKKINIWGVSIMFLAGLVIGIFWLSLSRIIFKDILGEDAFAFGPIIIWQVIMLILISIFTAETETPPRELPL